MWSCSKIYECALYVSMFVHFVIVEMCFAMSSVYLAALNDVGARSLIYPKKKSCFSQLLCIFYQSVKDKKNLNVTFNV